MRRRRTTAKSELSILSEGAAILFSGLSGEPPQQKEMLHHGFAHGGMLAIRDMVLTGSLSYDFGEMRIMRMADTRAKVMDDMMIQPTEKHRRHPTLRRVIRGGC